MGGVPPTRHVAGGHVGMNLYLSEIVSDIVEPLAEGVVGGTEVISTEDMVAQVIDTNDGMVGWNKLHAWDEVQEGGYSACGVCEGDAEYTWDIGNPEWCKCIGCFCEQTNDGKYRVKGNVLLKDECGNSDSMGMGVEQDVSTNASKGTARDITMMMGEMTVKGTVPVLEENKLYYDDKYGKVGNDMGVLSQC